ncbi:cytochrome P450 [Mycobacterium sp. ENV421]|uniref:cytochrome P450 n=1 Tax=Mycobacterium sp. ENV421 TaxID=1213407 RepID=UPI000C9A6C82|nr:cytochrome P450 [Mycobacterium sp. ENV421]PND54793.1 cytochrome P450 [Mycobacterium sp. ENV421]
MVETLDSAAVAQLPLAPKNPLPYGQRLNAARALATGPAVLRDAGGPVTRNVLGPKWLMPPVVVVTSPQGVRDVLSRTDAFVDRGTLPWMVAHRRLVGGNMLDLPHDEWLRRRRTIQPLFTRQSVTRFAGHMTEAAEQTTRRWSNKAEVDFAADIPAMTLRALGLSILGQDLGARAESVGPAMRAAFKWVADRATRPINAPWWVSTPKRRQAQRATDAVRQLGTEILRECRADPGRDAPVVHALIAATDPQTGRALSDDEICDQLCEFMFAGHDTVSTVLTYALWALGRHRDLQDRVAAEVAGVGDHSLTPDDVARLGFSVRVLHEAMRLCPPGPSLPRMVMKDIDVAGYRVEAGTVVIVGAYAMHRDPALWDDPLEFDPDRFSPENSKSRDRWQYVPFGGGPRACSGSHFVMLESTLALATIIRATEIRSLDQDFPIATPFTLIPAGPIRAAVRTRAA